MTSRDASLQKGALAFATWAAAALLACSQKPLVFSHETHLTNPSCGGEGEPACLKCVSCHAPTKEGRAERLPGVQLCASCHQENSAKMERLVTAPPVRPYGQISFNHDEHLDMASIAGQCVPCHKGVVEDGVAALPPMSQCFSCHEHEQQWQRSECSPCHERAHLQRTLPRTFLRHDQFFLKNHTTEAQTQETLCKSCHTQSDCQSCHDLSLPLSMEQQRPDAIMTNQVHRGDFMVRHAMEARSQPARCMTCHTPPDCDSCHIEQGVSGTMTGGRNPHPPGWVGGNPQSRDFHGRAARRDLLSCAGCHEAGPLTNCIRCHQVGGPGKNPHPAGWKSTRQPSDEMCSYCHRGLE